MKRTMGQAVDEIVAAWQVLHPKACIQWVRVSALGNETSWGIEICAEDEQEIYYIPVNKENNS